MKRGSPTIGDDPFPVGQEAGYLAQEHRPAPPGGCWATTLWPTMMRQPGAPEPGILGPCADNVTASTAVSTAVSTVTLWLHGNVALFAWSDADPDPGPQMIMGIGLIAGDPNRSKVTVVESA